MRAQLLSGHTCRRAVTTPLGVFTIIASDVGITEVTFPGIAPRRLIASKPTKRNANSEAILDAAVNEMYCYFKGDLLCFASPIDLSETSAFKRDIYETLMTIPFGDTVTYGLLAALAGHPGKARAVGGAMAQNPVPLFIPCHRVTGANGKLGGWSGPPGLKTTLLDFEKSVIEKRTTSTPVNR